MEFVHGVELGHLGFSHFGSLSFRTPLINNFWILLAFSGLQAHDFVADSMWRGFFALRVLPVAGARWRFRCFDGGLGRKKVRPFIRRAASQSSNILIHLQAEYQQVRTYTRDAEEQKHFGVKDGR